MRSRRPPPIQASAPTLLVLTLLAAALVALPGAQAQEAEAQLTFHDDEDAASSTTVSCEFWVRGHNLMTPDGRLAAAHQLDGPSAHDHEMGNYSGTENEDGTFDFLAGPFTLHMSDEFLIMAIPDNETDRGAAADLTYIACGDEDEEDPFTFECPHDILATANADGSVTLDWSGDEDADRYIVHRRLAGEEDFADFEEIGTTEDTTFDDMTTEGGVTYEYFISAEMDSIDGTFKAGCGTAQVTTIPNFGVIAGAIVGVALVGMYAVVRRRR